ncbi:unnamed protein product [Wuchereria bancrofti]|uniref:Uncharacterized protein n=1 Tax=Wuchereria bancrofti TaxID=6293 RepID=A0A3P7FT87_WUCBA|nr:unnamed protein product [Wuchereria bancrofti]
MAEQRRNDNSEYVKEQNHVYARRMITTIAITLTILAVFLVTLSLLLGSRIDQIVFSILVNSELNKKCINKFLFENPTN